jgi:hypothetical protein
MLLITVATTVLPRRRPSALSCRAHMSITASPSTMRPASSAKIARSPSPSNATPPTAPTRDTASAIADGCVDPQCRLMLRPSGEAPSSVTSKPRPAEKPGRHGGRRPIGAIDDELRAGQGPRVIELIAKMRQVGLGAVDLRNRGRVVPIHVPRRSGDDGLDLPLEILGELVAGAGEHLDAVVLIRVVRRRDHRAQ